MGVATTHDRRSRDPRPGDVHDAGVQPGTERRGARAVRVSADQTDPPCVPKRVCAERGRLRNHGQHRQHHAGRRVRLGHGDAVGRAGGIQPRQPARVRMPARRKQLVRSARGKAKRRRSCRCRRRARARCRARSKSTRGKSPGTSPRGKTSSPTPAAAMGAMDGCNQLPFQPLLSVTPDVQQTSTPSGLSVEVHLTPGDSDELRRVGQRRRIKEMTIALPEGVTINPAAAGGAETCSEGLVGFTGFGPPPAPPGGSGSPGSSGARAATFTPTLPGGFGSSEPLQPGVNFCANVSKIGKAVIKTPLLARTDRRRRLRRETETKTRSGACWRCTSPRKNSTIGHGREARGRRLAEPGDGADHRDGARYPAAAAGRHRTELLRGRTGAAEHAGALRDLHDAGVARAVVGHPPGGTSSPRDPLQR